MEDFAQDVVREVAQLEVNPFVALLSGGILSTTMGALAFHRKRASLLRELGNDMFRVQESTPSFWQRLLPRSALPASAAQGSSSAIVSHSTATSLAGSQQKMCAAINPPVRVAARSSSTSFARHSSGEERKNVYGTELFDDDCAFLGLEPGTAGAGGHGGAHALRLHTMSTGGVRKSNCHPYQQPIDARITAVFTKREIAWLLLAPATFIGCVGGAGLIAMSRYLGVRSPADIQDHYWWLFRSGPRPQGVMAG